MNQLMTLGLVVFSLFLVPQATAHVENEHGAILKFADSRTISELSEINKVLKTVGVSLERIEVPTKATPILRSAVQAPLSDADTLRVLDLFSLSREEIINQAIKSNRQPVIAGGGSMTSGEVGVAPYPKIYDLKSMSHQDRLGARDKFGPLHINATDDMTGVDEVMTLAVGGAWTWYFQVGNQAVELHMSKVAPGEPAWRLNYPGTTPHGAYFHSTDGVVIAHITGPKTWKMRYEAPELPNNQLLGTNPFINFDLK